MDRSIDGNFHAALVNRCKTDWDAICRMRDSELMNRRLVRESREAISESQWLIDHVNSLLRWIVIQ